MFDKPRKYIIPAGVFNKTEDIGNILPLLDYALSLEATSLEDFAKRLAEAEASRLDRWDEDDGPPPAYLKLTPGEKAIVTGFMKRLFSVSDSINGSTVKILGKPPVLLENVVTGENVLITSVTEAAKELEVNRTVLSEVVSGKRNKAGDWKVSQK